MRVCSSATLMVAPKVFHPRMVRVGARDGGNVEIIAGLLPNEVVAAKGSGLLLKELLLGQKLSIPLEAFRLDRPTTTPVRPAFRS